MGNAEVAAALRETLWVMLKLGGVPLLVLLVVGFVVSLLQAVTQINEATATFLPKLLVLGGVLVLMGPFMATALNDYAQVLFDRLLMVGGG